MNAPRPCVLYTEACKQFATSESLYNKILLRATGAHQTSAFTRSETTVSTCPASLHLAFWQVGTSHQQLQGADLRLSSSRARTFARPNAVSYSIWTSGFRATFAFWRLSRSSWASSLEIP